MEAYTVKWLSDGKMYEEHLFARDAIDALTKALFKYKLPMNTIRMITVKESKIMWSLDNR